MSTITRTHDWPRVSAARAAEQQLEVKRMVKPIRRMLQKHTDRRAVSPSFDSPVEDQQLLIKKQKHSEIQRSSTESARETIDKAALDDRTVGDLKKLFLRVSVSSVVSPRAIAKLASDHGDLVSPASIRTLFLEEFAREELCGLDEFLALCLRHPQIAEILSDGHLRLGRTQQTTQQQHIQEDAYHSCWDLRFLACDT